MWRFAQFPIPIPSSLKSNRSMEDRSQGAAVSDGAPVRSRWTPKQEQIQILESIFNSGMVNPPKDETVRIRKLLEKFGSVGDANVFYWFQNRRSRYRRRQRQIEASLRGSVQSQEPRGGFNGGIVQFDQMPNSAPDYSINNANSFLVGSSSSSPGGCAGNNSDDFFSFQSQHEQNSISCADLQNYQSEVITVFINGVATVVKNGALNVKSLFGEDVVLVDSSGVAVEVNHCGFLLQSLHHGESYFLVPRHS